MPDIVTTTLRFVGRTAVKGAGKAVVGGARGALGAGRIMMNVADEVHNVANPYNPAAAVGRKIGGTLERMGQGVSAAFAAKAEKAAAQRAVVQDIVERTGASPKEAAKQAYIKGNPSMGRRIASNTAQGIIGGSVFAAAVVGVSGPAHRSASMRADGLLQEQAERDVFLDYPGTTRTAGNSLGVDGDTVFAAHNLHGTGKRGRY